jgi:ribokinase
VDVVGLGYCSYDILAIVPGTPRFDDVRGVHVTNLVQDGGGPVGTALTTVARLGGETSYIGILGDDQEGRWLRDLYLRDGVDVARLRLGGDSILEPPRKAGTNVCLVLVEQSTGKRAILCHQRVAKADLVLEEADRTCIQGARALHLDGQFLPAALQAARWAREAGVKVCFDGNHPRPGLEELLPLVDWLVVAEPFPGEYTGLADPAEAGRALLDLGAQVVVVTLGERGCQVWSEDEQLTVPGFPVRAVDTTGAGDAFHGAFLYGMLQGWDLRRVARFANAVAAINCRTLGGRRGLPDLAQVKRLVKNL